MYINEVVKILNNKLGITNNIELAKEEERITKIKALELFDTNKINEIRSLSYDTLNKVKECLDLNNEAVIVINK